MRPTIGAAIKPIANLPSSNLMYDSQPYKNSETNIKKQMIIMNLMNKMIF